MFLKIVGPIATQSALEKRKVSDAFTNASFRVKRMPEDLSPVESNYNMANKKHTFTNGEFFFHSQESKFIVVNRI